MSEEFASIYFDCDSTLATIEGIDALSRSADAVVQAEVAALTNRAMDGEIDLAEVYARRLALLQPSRDAVLAIGKLYIDNLVEDAAAVIAALHALGKRVGIISGGLLPAVALLADELEIPAERVRAVALDFNPKSGAYIGFDHRQPLARNRGKPEILAQVPAAERPLCFVGDGITDLEAATATELFIGFGGVARRARVVAEAGAYVDGPSLAGVLQICLSPAERQRLADDSRFSHLLT